MANELFGRSLPRDAVDVAAMPPGTRTVGWLAVPVGILVLLLAWKVVAVRLRSPWLLPDPGVVASSLVENRALLWWHTQATVLEVVLGFLAGFSVAALLGYVISHSQLLERLLTPYVVASQAVPIVAVAPLLVFWFHPGLPVKVTAAALIVFFPMLVNTVVAFRNIPASYRELMLVLSAGRRQVLTDLEVPAALPYLLGGVRVGVTLSVIGAVVGEFLGSDRGLGSLVQISSGQYNDSLLFAALVTLVTLALLLYAAAAALERVLLKDR
jgi:NitT/TauT family transport system permease protein